MNSLWFLIYVIATNNNGNGEPHILSCGHRLQTWHYNFIESTGQEVLVFWFTSLAHTDNYLFTKGGRVKVINLLKDYEAFADISVSSVNDVVVHVVIIPKICLKPPCEEYATMGAELQLSTSAISQ